MRSSETHSGVAHLRLEPVRLEPLCLAPLRRSEITACRQMVRSAVAALAPHPYSLGR